MQLPTDQLDMGDGHKEVLVLKMLNHSSNQHMADVQKNALLVTTVMVAAMTMRITRMRVMKIVLSRKRGKPHMRE